MQHYYIGVEHLFIAMLEIRTSLARGVLEEVGLPPTYVIEAIRAKVGKGSKRRLWADNPNTPRATAIFALAEQIAQENNRSTVNQRDIFLAILEEGKNIPAHVLKQLGLKPEQLIQIAHRRELNPTTNQSYRDLKIIYGPNFENDPPLSQDHLLILRRMFNNCSQIRLETRMRGGYTRAVVLAVVPVNPDGRATAPVVVKIDKREDILDEAQRYERHIKGTLPPLTARLEDKPVVSEINQLGGLKYTIVTREDQTPQDLRAAISEHAIQDLSEWLQNKIYNSFGSIWWKQRRPFSFSVWMEYDWLLPPLLTLQFIPPSQTVEVNHTLSGSITPNKLQQIGPGDIIALEGFSIHNISPENNTFQLSFGRGGEASKRAYKVKVTHLNLEKAAHYRGELIPRLVGRVWQTRSDVLLHAAETLNSPFNLSAKYISVRGPASTSILPNPLHAYERLLFQLIDGSSSKIHGDLHLGNILLGPSESAFLIDFTHSREGHAVFDWATLEISLLSEVIMPLAGEDWNASIQVLVYLDALNNYLDLPDNNPALKQAFAPLVTLRNIVKQTLNTPDNWDEYYIALAYTSLRAITWETMPITGRRCLFLVAALAFYEIHKAHNTDMPTGNAPTEKPDMSDVPF